jgi:hypothetical protein
MGQELRAARCGCSLTLPMCALGGNVPPQGTPRRPSTFVSVPTAPAPAVLEGKYTTCLM